MKAFEIRQWMLGFIAGSLLIGIGIGMIKGEVIIVDSTASVRSGILLIVWGGLTTVWHLIGYFKNTKKKEVSHG